MGPVCGRREASRSFARTGLGALLGGHGALPQAFGAVENARVRVWLCGECQTGRRTRGLCATALIR